MATIGDRVRLVREQLGISQSRLAKAVKIAPQTIQQLEAGDSQGSKHLLAIARELRVNPDWLLTGKGDQGSPSAAAMRTTWWKYGETNSPCCRFMRYDSRRVH
jgi:transcriptional regulator with XRE-family HTH domain